MSNPILYSSTETNFDHNGYGILGDCAGYEVTEEGNGVYDLTMLYPMDGIHFEDISDRSILKAKFDKFTEPQLFRVKTISKPMSGIVTVYAEHISYDLSGIPVKPFSAESVALALTGLKTNAVVNCPFEFWTDKSTVGSFNVITPSSIRSKLGGYAGSILDVYGGEYEFDNYTVKLYNNRGTNRGVSIRYGKNLTDIRQEQNCALVATGVYPFWLSQDGAVLIELPEKIINAPGSYNFVKIRTLDLSAEFEVQPTVEQLRSTAENYILNNNIGVPVVSITASFAQLEQSVEYEHLQLLERVGLFDTVNVEFPALGVSATAKAVKIVYDGVAERVKTVTIGSVRENIADTIATQKQELAQKPSKSFLQKAVESLTGSILGANGGSVRLLDTDEDGELDTLYIADNPDTEKAVKVWRFNYEGWGASDNGYVGPFKLGATLKDGIVADFITAGTLTANLLKAGIITDLMGRSFWNLETGELRLVASALNLNDTDVGAELDDIKDTYATNASVNAAIKQSAANIDQALEGYLANGDFEEFKKDVTAELALLSNNLTIQFEEVSKQLNSVDNDLQEKFNTITTYFTFEVNGLTIGKTDNPYKMVLDNDSLSLLADDVELLWMDVTTKEIHTPRLAVTEQISSLGYVEEKDSAGNVNSIYVG